MQWKRALSVGLMGSMLWSASIPFDGLLALAEGSTAGTATAATANAFKNLQVESQEPITSGAILTKYVWQSDKGAVRFQVIEVDLQNPYVKVDSILGKGNKVAIRDNISDLAKATNAVAATNGDFFVVSGDGAPLGPQVHSGEWVSSPAKLNEMYALGITKDNQPMIEHFTFDGTITAPNGMTFPLSGINKAMYWEDPDRLVSHVDKLQLYTSAWGKKERGTGSYTIPTELLIQNGVVQEISVQKAFDRVPPEGGYLLRGNRKAAQFLEANFKVGDPIQIDYRITPDKDWSMVIGGHSLLVDEGKPLASTKDLSALGGTRARTAVGYKQDGRYLDMISVEGKTEESVGVSLTDLAAFMAKIGIWRGLNLDGGGSTTAVARPLGETELTSLLRPENGTERLVANGLGVYSTAPKGELAGIKIVGPQLLFLNETASYRPLAYDNFYNPMNASNFPIDWKLAGTAGSILNGKFIPARTGTIIINASTGQWKAELGVEVVGKRQLSRLSIKPAPLILLPGESAKVSVEATTASGRVKTVPVASIQWTATDVDATIQQDGTVTLKSGEAGNRGFVIARYDQYSAVLPIIVGSTQKSTDFEGNTEAAFIGNTADVAGDFKIEPDNVELNNHVGTLTYDFTKGTGIKAAYISFKNGGLPVQGIPLQMQLAVKGDGGGHWLRAELTDGAGKIHRLTLADSVDWTDWNTLTLDLSQEKFTAPVTLNRIYLVNPELGQDERALTGAISLDHLRFKVNPAAARPIQSTVINMAIGKKAFTMNQTNQSFRLAPTIYGNSTFVPLRDLSEILGAKVLYEAAARRASFYKEDQWVDVWQGDKQVVAGGHSLILNAEPRNIGGVMMVPLRVISETLGMKVTWDGKTRSITLNKSNEPQ